MILSQEVVLRKPPENLRDGDQKLFEHEFKKTLGEVNLEFAKNLDFFPNGLITANRGLLPHPFSFHGRVTIFWAARTILRLVLFRLSARRISFAHDKKVLVITDQFSNAYFHWICDCLPKLKVLEDRQSEFVLLLPQYLQNFRFVADSLQLWPRLEVRYANTHEILGVREVWRLPAVATTGNFRPHLMNGLGEDFRLAYGKEGKPFRRVYVSRSKAKFRRIENESDVFEVLKRYGFEMFYLEDLLFEDQVRLLSETQYLVSNHGAGLTNMLFMRAEGRVLEIRSMSDNANNCYFSLASALDLKYYYSLAKVVNDKEGTHTADLIVDLPNLEKTLQGFLS